MNFVATAATPPASTLQISHEPQAQLRGLYCALLESQEHFDEFKQLLALYPVPAEPVVEEETADAARVRATLNAKLRSWVAGPFADLSASQVLQWRAIVVDERLNVSVSPWKESSAY